MHGEAGIGKTALMRWAIGQARSRGTTPTYSRAYSTVQNQNRPKTRSTASTRHNNAAGTAAPAATNPARVHTGQTVNARPKNKKHTPGCFMSVAKPNSTPAKTNQAARPESLARSRATSPPIAGSTTK